MCTRGAQLSTKKWRSLLWMLLHILFLGPLKKPIEKKMFLGPKERVLSVLCLSRSYLNTKKMNTEYPNFASTHRLLRYYYMSCK
jgi:hypothetical protein